MARKRPALSYPHLRRPSSSTTPKNTPSTAVPSSILTPISSIMSRLSTTVLLSILLLLLVLLDLTLATPASSSSSSPTTASITPNPSATVPASTYWLQNIPRRGSIPYSNNTGYQLFRNVRDFGATGDGTTDDTAAINAAISYGARCGDGCDSSTTTPALVYFPAGTYLVSTPIVMYYYTQCVGDATDLPTVKGAPGFYGLGIFDSDPYLLGGANWYTNQNNFFRQVRNFIIDMTDMPASYGNGIHWQVAQATSLQNIVFNMVQGGSDNQQQGIFMDNGSGGWMGDMIFNGGHVCMLMGNQQFTVANVTFNNCQTAVYQNWGWVWAYKDFAFNNCDIGLDISHGGSVQVVGSVVLQDSVFNNVTQAIVTTFDSATQPVSGGSLVVDNVDFTGADLAISYPNGTVIVDGGQVVDSFVQGRVYAAYFTAETIGNKTCLEPGANGTRVQEELAGPPKPPVLLDSTGRIFMRSKPQYEGEPVSAFVSVKANGATGDGVTDDTAAIQAIFDAATIDQIVYFDHGAYVVSDTIQVPGNIRMTGECWPMIMALGTAFSDQDNPKPVWRVGNPGDVGHVEMSDMIFETIGPAPGAIIMEWNLAGDIQGNSAMWDVHWRIGGTAGTQLQSNSCPKTPQVQTSPDPNCIGAFLLLHITEYASVLMENNWGWVADHELDLPDHSQINIYNGRGVLVESQAGVWMYGTSFEHSMLYNYNIANANSVFMSVIQTETAYMQDNPNALVPFAPLNGWSDPQFSNCFQAICYKTMGLQISNSNNILNYGAGLYSFFNNYDSGCLVTASCQEQMIAVDNSSTIYLYAASTKASQVMVEIDGVSVVPQGPNTNTFCDTVVLFEEP